jgi:YD repeat-containing protein
MLLWINQLGLMAVVAKKNKWWLTPFIATDSSLIRNVILAILQITSCIGLLWISTAIAGGQKVTFVVNYQPNYVNGFDQCTGSSASPTIEGSVAKYMLCSTYCNQANYTAATGYPSCPPSPSKEVCGIEMLSSPNGPIAGIKAIQKVWRYGENGWSSNPTPCATVVYAYMSVSSDSCDASDTCLPRPEKDPGKPCVANPISLFTGAKIQRELDYSGGASGLKFERIYSSAESHEGGWFARQWRSLLDMRVQAWPAVAIVSRDDGRRVIYTPSGGQWSTDNDANTQLEPLGTLGTAGFSGWRWTDEDGSQFEFDVSGRLLRVVQRNGIVQTVLYSDANTSATVAPGPGYAIALVGSFGDALKFVYDASGKLVQLTDPSGVTITYQYTPFLGIYAPINAVLTAVTYQNGFVRTYLYNESAFVPQNPSRPLLTGVVDENNVRFATWKYDSNYRAISSEHAGGVEKVTLNYSTTDRSVAATNALGGTTTSVYRAIFGVAKTISSTQPCTWCGSGSSQNNTYDANGNVTVKIDFEGNRTNYTYDLTRNLETSRTEGLAAGGATTPATRTISTTWHSTLQLPLTITEPVTGGSKVTTNTYDISGNLTQRQVATPAGSRTWNWTYDQYGRVLTATDPLGRVSTNTYYPNTEAQNTSLPNSRGMLATATNPLGHTTTITSYNPHGQPLSITDANGLVTSMTYDTRQRMTTRTVNNQTTTYQYDGVGQLTKVTLPDASYLTYTYDGAHRLTQIQDGLNNKITYTLDNIGNRTAEYVTDASGALARTRSRVYDALNRLQKDIGGATPATQVTQYTYDNNGNQTGMTDPLSRITTNSYDALNRLIQVNDPVNGTTAPTKYEYDAQDNLTKVTDPKNLATTYSYNGFNELVSQTSPDTNTTSFTYDANGNMLTKTDARNLTVTYQYDNLNRVSVINYPAVNSVPAQTITYTYDTCSNGKVSVRPTPLYRRYS